MKKYLVLFLTPVAVLEDWMKTDPEVRKATESTMKADWDAWIANNSAAIVDMPAGAGKTKMVNKDGVTNTKNNIMMYATVQANTDEEAAALFINHPHLGIPQASIEIMGVNTIMTGN